MNKETIKTPLTEAEKEEYGVYSKLGNLWYCVVILLCSKETIYEFIFTSPAWLALTLFLVWRNVKYMSEMKAFKEKTGNGRPLLYCKIDLAIGCILAVAFLTGSLFLVVPSLRDMIAPQ